MDSAKFSPQVKQWTLEKIRNVFSSQKKLLLMFSPRFFYPLITGFYGFRIKLFVLQLGS